ncbi:carboxylesterase family protein [Bordetella sp. 15P40C-2]|uniref:carboxylesterase family protein n=1 Tax=Bordetella sp. 15P40C-2 TaxID=2572246 RepID=UPI001327FD9B|nr:carboxylesterase family protein [Bordetella sp. 15P40C-2]MVW71843.1 carboxylesterase family protein [Bordetella sp. 15P40C-2]
MSETITIALPQGTVRGIRESRVLSFHGVPYGEAPVGPLRFAAPRPARWSGECDATRAAPVAPQLPSRLRDAMGDFDARQDEDCLRLSIWVPADGAIQQSQVRRGGSPVAAPSDVAGSPAKPHRRPVLIWLHGGAWQSGGILPWYDGARLAAEGDMVVVAVSYRLAALGWLPLPDATPNAGLLDQELAIGWVIEHIAAFGGDPEAITVMGQSAGATSICAMLTRQPRFSRAILQSGSLGRGWRSAEQGARLAHAYLGACGVNTTQEAAALPVETLLAAQQHPDVLKALQAEGSGRSLFAPVLDGDILTTDMQNALAAAVGRADVLVSYTRDEMAAFPGQGVNPQSAALGNAIFDQPARQWAADAIKAGRQAWLARFDVAPTQRFGACHCIELPFVFGTLDAFPDAPMLHGLKAVSAESLSQRTRKAWIAFVHGESPGWPMAPHQQIFDVQ